MASNYGNLTGQTLGTCTLEQLVGQGGMGAVYLARQARPSRNVAVKVLQPNMSMGSEVYQEFLVRFRREADVIARLDHVNIMPIYEYGEQANLAYLVMPYFSGGSLREVLNRRGTLTLNEAMTYIDQAASALDYAHAQGVVHRDLKPANFLLAGDGRLVLADFGIARIIEESAAGAGLTGTGTILGTPEYMAPEMARGEPIDYRVDIYELGVVLFQMLSGRLPFSGSTPLVVVARHIQEPLPLLSRENPLISSAVDAVIQKATAKYPNDRYTSTREMAQALRNAASAGISTATAYERAGDGTPATRAGGQPPVILPTPPMAQAPQYNPQYNTPPPQQMRPYNTMQGTNGSGMYSNQTPQPGSYGTYPAPQPYAPQKPKSHPLWWVVGILLTLVLITFGVLAGVELTRGKGLGANPTPTSVSGTTPGVTATTQTTPTTAVTPTATTQPTATTAPSPTATQPTTGVPLGQQLYATGSPGPRCDQNGGTWAATDGLQLNCLGNRTRLSNTMTNLQGIFLTALPAAALPTNYVVHVRLQQSQASSADFGVFFRNQPGNNQQGAYAFLIHNDGSWSAYVYDNNNGQPRELTKGTGALNNIHTAVTLDIVVNGQQFTFYADGNLLGTTTDATYTNGTAGIAVNQGGIVSASNFKLYATAA
ncbi:MAG TPA: protein kinase [Ktedonobacteraceae bacterium]|nr:protein kinase [Ktedonobacteraceae bacterium]